MGIRSQRLEVKTIGDCECWGEENRRQIGRPKSREVEGVGGDRILQRRGVV